MRFGAVALLVVVMLVIVGGRWWFAPATNTAVDSHVTTPYLVVVGTEQHDFLSDTDRTVLNEQSVQMGILRVPTGDDQCAAAGWASLGAGDVVETGAICRPEVTADGAIADWRALQESAGGRLGALADLPGSCVAAVGPEAALGAARSDGTVSVYQSVAEFSAGGNFLSCPITLVAASTGHDADAVIADLVTRDNVTVLRVGLGPDHAGATPQAFYRTATTLPGLSTGPSARFPGTLELTDVAGALRAFHVETADEATAPLQVVEAPMGERAAQELLNGSRALAERDGLVIAGMVAVVIAALALGGLAFGLRKGWSSNVGVIVTGAVTTWPGALLSVGLVDWWRADQPLPMVVGCTAAMVVGFSSIVLVVHRLGPAWPSWVTGTVISLTVLLIHAAWGSPARLGSVLDRPNLDDASLGSAAVAVSVVALVVVLGVLGAFNWRWVVFPVLAVGALTLGGAGWMLIGVVMAAALVLWLLKLDAGASAYRLLGAGPVALVASVTGAAAVIMPVLRHTREVSELIIVVLGLGCWTVVHGWLAPGRAGAELDLAALRVPALVAIVGVALASPDPAWAWLIGSLFFALVTGAGRVVGQRAVRGTPT